MFNKIKFQSGFMSFLFLPFVALMMTGIIGFSFLSVGIKNITRSQSYCIRANLNGQKELGVLLTKLLSLNDKVLFFHTTRKTLEASLVTATALGMAGLIPSFKKKLEIVKQTQRTLMIKQNHLLAKSVLVKRTVFDKFKRQLKNLNIFDVQEETFYKKALAVRRKKKGDRAYIYKPVPDFVNHQKSRFFWKMNPFFPLDENWQILLQTKQKNFSNYSCTASLKKKGEKWTSILYH